MADTITEIGISHELSGVLVTRCEHCRHAAASHVDGRCSGFPAVDETGGSDVCRCTEWVGQRIDLGVLGRTPERT